ncbi:MAG: hypothetical protein D8M58_20540 [Calditrichaeota bacterium]|nr:MAG: hypothetical protein DWQ03_00870 [Calditrichota bacterium]MBL1207799.1 hypothetical protein [Calditrichota bacterium]NOG47633.1 hypothetical protein [Calditrichota bacterium]
MRFLLISIFFLSTQLYSQDTNSDIIVYEAMELSGPRIGFSYLSESFRNTINRKVGVSLEPFMAQFGWQFEKRFFTISTGATAVSEWVALIGGFEQEKFLPSLSWLIGMRSADGFEFGAGPNVSLSGTSVVIAAGVTVQS